MSDLIRGRRTGPASIPRTWRGPLPDPSIRHKLDDDGGYTRVPATLLHLPGAPDLGIMIWALLRLRNDARPDETNYRNLAQYLHLDHLSDSALEQRMGAAVKPLLGVWIIRRKVSTRRHTYRAVVPPGAEGRYALLRPRELEMLSLPARGSRPQMLPSDIINFCRWQLECGQRGWTANTLREIARRWNVGLATASRHRDRLVALNLLEVTKRSDGRLSDLVWLKEVFNPYWELPTKPLVAAGPASAEAGPADPGSGQESCSIDEGLALDSCSISQGESDGSCSISHDDLVPESRGLIRKLANSSLTDEDLANLGGASAAPLTSVPREVAAAPPAASRKKNHSDEPLANQLQVSASLVSRYQTLARAKPHFRRAVISRLAAALEAGLSPGHADRALARVVQEGSYDAECLLLRRALQQARADQMAGMCADCGGDADDHRRGCGQFAGTWDETPVDAPLPGRRTVTAGEDPLAVLVARPIPDGEQPLDEAETVEWLIVHLARQLLRVSDREARLRAIVLGLRAKAPPAQHDVINQAAEHVRYALSRSMAS